MSTQKPNAPAGANVVASADLVIDPRVIGEPGDPPRPSGIVPLERLGLVVSVAVHLILVVWIVGLLGSTEKFSQDEAIPITLVPAEAAPAVPPSAPKATGEAKAPAPPQRLSDVATPSPAEAAADIKPVDGPTPDKDRDDGRSDRFAAFGMANDGRPTTLTNDELNALRAKAKRCWRIPTGWTEPRQVSVTVRFRLNRDGTLNGKPAVVEFPATELGKAAADDAIRAVLQCSPFDLPVDKYEEWKDIQLRFEP
jgi:hypothetical protein